MVKATARKVRRLFHDRILAGFAGGTADAFTLFERFEAKLEKHQGHLVRSAVELAKDWRTDRILRRLEAMLAVADHETSLIHHRQRRRAGAGGRPHRHWQRRPLCAERGRALLEHTQMTPPEVVKQALTIAADLCIYTNQQSRDRGRLGAWPPALHA